ncbi:hypothetical protein TNIN_91621 [Trichonephila inaurata madagascariensis]|uniref:Uncharacterized protein n=1 Tax=Trichonephila inaurata madagascariensis TaxID=2747483 RepID=A0A8X7CBS4_9ARAC|nr:hypothetical protein TNIN_91621 [Trichonephila inaurata madagascariensis]
MTYVYKQYNQAKKLLTSAAVPRQQGSLQKRAHEGIPVPGGLSGHGDGFYTGQGKQHHGPHLLGSGSSPCLRLQRALNSMAG